MKTDPPVQVVLSWLEALERHDLDSAGDQATPDFVHTSGPGVRPVDWATWTSGHLPLWQALPDLRHNAHSISEADGVVTGRFRITATHTGHLRMPQLGIDDLAPTGLAISLPAEPFTAVVRDGKMATLEVDIPPGGGLQAFLHQVGHPPVALPE